MCSNSSGRARWPGTGSRDPAWVVSSGHISGTRRGLPRAPLQAQDPRQLDSWSPESTVLNRLPPQGSAPGRCLGFSSQSTGFKGRWRSAWIRTQPSTAESYQPLEMSGFILEEEEAGRLKKVPISQHRVGCAALPWSRFPPHTPKSGVFAFKEEQRQPQNKIEISQTREGHPPMKRERKHLETLRQRSANRSQGSSFLGSCKY